LATDKLDEPNPECPVCSVATVRARVDLENATLGMLVQDILRRKLGYGEEITVMNSAGIVYDPDLEDNLEKKLSDLDIGEGSFVVVKDEEDDDPRVDLQLAIEAKKPEDGEQSVILVEKEGKTFEIPKRPVKKSGTGGENADEDDGFVMVNGDSNAAPATGKRKRPIEDDAEDSANPAKKLQGPKSSQIPQNSGAQAIVIDEDNGAFVIEDDD
jgi:ubiquitin-like 1-activating enzyme E1 B